MLSSLLTPNLRTSFLWLLYVTFLLATLLYSHCLRIDKQWIFGGGFEIGTSALYDGGLIVDRSQTLSQPVVYVSMNYRLNGFGFLAGKEVKSAGAGNLGLHDRKSY